MTVSDARQRFFAPTVGDVLWAGLIALYLLLRLPAVTSIPVASIELFDLTAAWRVHVGDATGSFQPTLAQAVALFSFEWTESEQSARWVAYVVGASVPFGIHALRQRLGEIGAAVAILVLAFNGPALYASSTASAAAFDLPLIVWMLVWVDRAHGPGWLWVLAGLLLALSGPMAGTFALAIGLANVARGGIRQPRQVAMGFGGALAGLAVASFQFGYGWDGLAVPPVHHLTNGYGSGLQDGSAGLLIPLYSFPALAGGIGGLALLITRWRQSGTAPNLWWSGVTAWWALTMIWLLSSLTSGSPVPLAATALPSALLAGYALDAWSRRLDEFEWRLPLMAFGGAGAALTGAGVVLAAWARRGEAGGFWESTILVLTLMAAFAALAVVAVGRRTLPTLVAAAALPATVLLLIGTVGVAFGADSEPMFSPRAEQPGRDLRALVQESADEIGGTIVVDQSLDEDLIWAFRGLPAYAVSSGVTLDAAVVVLPLDSPPPEGFTALANAWRLVTYTDPPPSLLRYVRWITSRNSLESSGLDVAVYLRTVE